MKRSKTGLSGRLPWRKTQHQKANAIAKKDAPKDSQGSSKRITYRVQCLPADCSWNGTREVLEAAFGFDEGHSDVVVHSLAYSSGYSGEKTATISSVILAQRLDEKTNQWTFEMSDHLPTHFIILDSHFEGLTPLNSLPFREAHHLDIVALSGLAGHAFTSFKPRGHDFMWLRDTLPADLPGTQVWIYGYDSKLTASRSFQDLEALSSTFRRVLVSSRRQYTGSSNCIPLVFLGHSLGGLILKEALVQMSHDNSPDVKATYKSTYGILFFGCPNQGMNIDSLLPWCDKQPNLQLLFTLKQSSERLRQLCRNFSESFDFPDSRIISFYETKLSPTAVEGTDGVWSMTGPLSILVDASSATHGRPGEDQVHHIHPINRNHSEMVKFCRKDVDYGVVLGFLEEFAQSASATVRARFTVLGGSQMNSNRNTIESQRSLFAKSEDNRQFNEIVRWLAPTAYECGHYQDDLEDARSFRHPGTCRWIESRPEFVKWSAGENEPTQPVLWIYAIPGAGKTVLASYLVDCANRSENKHIKPHPVLYFFCKNADADKNNPLAIAKALAHQLFQSPQIVQSDFMKDLKFLMDQGGRTRAINFRPLFKLICQHLYNLPRATIVIDAADECSNINLLLPGLIELTHRSSVKIILTSRREPDLIKIFGDRLNLDMGPEDLREDIRAYLEYQVDQSRILSDPRVRHRIIRILNIRSKGMFLWVALMVKELELQSTIEELEDALDSLPEGLNEVYERILTRLHDSLMPSRKTFCCRLLKWITLAKRPLQLTEVGEALKLQYATAIDDSGRNQHLLCSARELESVCGSLVTVKDGTIQLIHLSTKEFLLNPTRTSFLRQELQAFFVEVEEDSALLSGICVMHLSSRCVSGRLLKDDSPKGWQMDDAKLLEYACFNWISHLTGSSWQALVRQEALLQPFLVSRKSFHWLEICFTIQRGIHSLMNTYLQSILDWCSFNLSNDCDLRHLQGLVSLLNDWAQSYLQLLADYGPSLESRPYEVHSIDPERIFKTSNLQILESFRHNGSYDRHYVLKSSQPCGISTDVPAHRALQRHTSTDNRYGFFCVDERRGAFFMLDKNAGKLPRIYCQEIATGRRLTPVVDTEFGENDVDLYTEGASLSGSGQHIGIVYTWCEIYRDVTTVRTVYTAIWLLPELLDFSGAAPPNWARKIISLSTVSSGSLTSTNPIAFDNDGFVYCPHGRVELATGVEKSIFSIRDNREPLDITFSRDGRSAISFVDHTRSIADVSPCGQLTTIHSYKEGTALKVGALSYTGRFLTWATISSSQTTLCCYVYDKHMRTTEELDTLSTITPDVRFLFTRDEKTLLGILDAWDSLDRKVTRVIIWKRCNSSFCLWADKYIRDRLLSFCYDERHHYLYMVSETRTWSRLDLKTKDLNNLDSELDETRTTRTEYEVHQDGSQMIILKQQFEKAEVQIVSLVDLTTLYKGLLKWPHDIEKSDKNPPMVRFSPNLKIVFVGNKLLETEAPEGEPLLLPLAQIDEQKIRGHGSQRKICSFSACSTHVALRNPSSSSLEDSGQLHIFQFDMKSKTYTSCNTQDICLSQSEKWALLKCEELRQKTYYLNEIKVGPQLLNLESGTTIMSDPSGILSTKCYASATHAPLEASQDGSGMRTEYAATKHGANEAYVLLASEAAHCLSWQVPSRHTLPTLSFPRVLCHKIIDAVDPMSLMDLRDAIQPHVIDTLPYHFPPKMTMPRLTVVPEHLKEAKVTFFLGQGHDPSISVLFSTVDGDFELKHLRLTMSEYMDRLQRWCETSTELWKQHNQGMEALNYDSDSDEDE